MDQDSSSSQSIKKRTGRSIVKLQETFLLNRNIKTPRIILGTDVQAFLEDIFDIGKDKDVQLNNENIEIFKTKAPYQDLDIIRDHTIPIIDWYSAKKELDPKKLRDTLFEIKLVLGIANFFLEEYKAYADNESPTRPAHRKIILPKPHLDNQAFNIFGWIKLPGQLGPVIKSIRLVKMPTSNVFKIDFGGMPTNWNCYSKIFKQLQD